MCFLFNFAPSAQNWHRQMRKFHCLPFRSGEQQNNGKQANYNFKYYLHFCEQQSFANSLCSRGNIHIKNNSLSNFIETPEVVKVSEFLGKCDEWLDLFRFNKSCNSTKTPGGSTRIVAQCHVDRWWKYCCFSCLSFLAHVFGNWISGETFVFT